MASDEIISGSDWEKDPESIYKKPREIKSRDPNRMDRWSIVINMAAVCIHTVAIFTMHLHISNTLEWFAFMISLIFLGYSPSAIRWSLINIKKNKKGDGYKRWLVEDHLWNAFFKKRSPKNTLNIAFNLDGVDPLTEKFWIDLYMKKVMSLYDHKDFNKKAYLEYQMQMPQNAESI